MVNWILDFYEMVREPHPTYQNGGCDHPPYLSVGIGVVVPGEPGSKEGNLATLRVDCTMGPKGYERVESFFQQNVGIDVYTPWDE